MTNQTNGNSEFQNVKVVDRLKTFEDELENYSTFLGLNFIRYNPSVQRILDLSEEDIKSLDAERCGESSYFLSNYSLYIQKECNRWTAKRNWCRSNLDMLVAKNNKQFSQYTKYEEKLNSICLENSAAMELNKMMVESISRIDELHDIAQRLDNMSRRLDELHKTKRQQNYGH